MPQSCPVVLTDHNEVVLEVLERNAALNPSVHGEPQTRMQQIFRRECSRAQITGALSGNWIPMLTLCWLTFCISPTERPR